MACKRCICVFLIVAMVIALPVFVSASESNEQSDYEKEVLSKVLYSPGIEGEKPTAFVTMNPRVEGNLIYLDITAVTTVYEGHRWGFFLDFDKRSMRFANKKVDEIIYNGEVISTRHGTIDYRDLEFNFEGDLYYAYIYKRSEEEDEMLVNGRGHSIKGFGEIVFEAEASSKVVDGQRIYSGLLMKKNKEYTVTLVFEITDDSYDEFGFNIRGGGVDSRQKTTKDYYITVETVNYPVVVKSKKTNEQKATCTEPASYDIEYTCSNGDEVIGRRTVVTGEALDHSYTSVVIPPSPGKKGYTLHTCSRCGHQYMDEYTGEGDDPDPIYDKYDINMDGDVNITDYLMVKAQVLGTKEFDAETIARMNVNDDKDDKGKDLVNITDYLWIKREVLTRKE